MVRVYSRSDPTGWLYELPARTNNSHNYLGIHSSPALPTLWRQERSSRHQRRVVAGRILLVNMAPGEGRTKGKYTSLWDLEGGLPRAAECYEYITTQQ